MNKWFTGKRLLFVIIFLLIAGYGIYYTFSVKAAGGGTG